MGEDLHEPQARSSRRGQMLPVRHVLQQGARPLLLVAERTATARRPTASRSGRRPSPGGRGQRIFHTTNWDMSPGERGEFPVAWMGSEPISRQGTLYLLYSGGDRLTIRKATIAAGY